MVTVNVGNDTYEVYFEYGHFEEESRVVFPLEYEVQPNFCECKIVNTNSLVSHYGQSRCSKGDNFEYVTARRLALERAVHGFGRKVKSEIWRQLRNTGMKI